VKTEKEIRKRRDELEDLIKTFGMSRENYLIEYYKMDTLKWVLDEH